MYTENNKQKRLNIYPPVINSITVHQRNSQKDFQHEFVFEHLPQHDIQNAISSEANCNGKTHLIYNQNAF